VAVYLKLGATDQHFKLQPKLASLSYFQSLSTHFFSRNIAVQSFFHGVLWVMLLFHLLFFVMNRDRAYLFFAAYILTLSISLFYTFGTHFYTVFAEYPRLGRVALLLSTFGYSYYYPRFLVEFLHKGEWRTDIKHLLNLYARLVLIAGVLATALLFLPVTIFKLTYGYWMLFPFSVIGLSSLTYISVLYWSSGNRMAKYIAANNMFMIFGLIVYDYKGGQDMGHARQLHRRIGGLCRGQWVGAKRPLHWVAHIQHRVGYRQQLGRSHGF